MPAPKLEARQSQSLVMTQQLQQSIKLLQLSSQELQEFIEGEIEQNPLLQGGEAEEFGSMEVDSLGAEGPAESTDEMDVVEFSDHNDQIDSPLDSSQEDQWESSEWTERQYPEAKNGSFNSSSDNFLEQTAASEPTLQDHLMEHLMCATMDMAQRLIGRHLIDQVNEAGYVGADYPTLAEVLGCEVEEIEAVIRLLQECDPPGLCARNLAECLRLQLKAKDRYDPAMRMLVENLPLLSRAEYTQLEQICGVDREDLRDMIAEIKQLNPKPGYLFSHSMNEAVEPDVLVRQHKNDWIIELNPMTMPKVLVDRPYFVKLSSHTREKDEKKYLNEQLANANWLIKALDQRARTLLKVSRAIIKAQENFFRYGIRYLKPLTLREVADAVEMHESTISRVTTRKYMATPSGMYELKYFFSSSIHSAHGGGISSKTVQHLIQGMIEKETVKDVLSDDAIAEKLKTQGVEVARRTVAKYRDVLNIPSSTQRRQRLKQVL